MYHILACASRPCNNDHVRISTQVLRYSVESTIPSILIAIGVEYLLPQPVVHPEIYKILVLYANWAEDIIEPVSVRCKARWYIFQH